MYRKRATKPKDTPTNGAVKFHFSEKTARRIIPRLPDAPAFVDIKAAVLAVNEEDRVAADRLTDWRR